MTEQYDPYEQDAQDADADDQVYLDAMTRTRIYIAAGFVMVGLIIAWPLIPGANWVDHSVFQPVFHWLIHPTIHFHFRMFESGAVMVYRVMAGVLTAVLTTIALRRYGWGPGITVGFLLMTSAVVVRLIIF